MKVLRRVALLVAALLAVGCAHASGFAGKWVGMSDGWVLTITATGNGHYVGNEPHGKSPVIFAFTRSGDRLVGYLKPFVFMKVDVIKLDASHIRLVSKAYRVTQEYRRQ